MDQFIRSYIEQTKATLRARQDVAAAFASVKQAIQREVDLIQQQTTTGRSVIPELTYNAIANDQVTDESRVAIRKRGCVVIRGVFSNSQAREWNEELGEYLHINDYLGKMENKVGLDNYFDDLTAAKPQIYAVYWSRPQVLARQAQTMATTKRFLNHLWSVQGPMGDEFDPDQDCAYADRTRRRAPGDTSIGLSPHMDTGSYERWVDPAFQKIYEPIFSGHWQDYDPWQAAFRTQTREYSSPAVCSMFRTFQGWTALTPQGPTDGSLQLLPVANSIAYTLLRGLQDDVPEGEFCLAKPGRALGVDNQWHPELIDGMVSIPQVEPGDTVWWHPDVVHAVGNEHAGSDYANVIYIGASPSCTKNKAYARRQAGYFLNGRSAPDFAAEDYEVNFQGRATVDDLTDLGRLQMCLE